MTELPTITAANMHDAPTVNGARIQTQHPNDISALEAKGFVVEQGSPMLTTMRLDFPGGLKSSPF